MKTQLLEIINLKNDGILNFDINQEKRAKNILKKLVAPNSISEETRRSLKPIGTRSGITYGLPYDLCIGEKHTREPRFICSSKILEPKFSLPNKDAFFNIRFPYH